MIEFVCKICGKKFWNYPSNHRVYCGLGCLFVSRRGKREYFTKQNNPNWKGGLPACFSCGKKLSNYHYKSCKSCWQKGENSHRWKGGVTPKARAIRTSTKYRRWRDEVFARDNYTCVICGVTNRKGLGRSVRMNADHIHRFADFPELIFDVSNGRTLCEGCHRKTKTFGRFIHD